MNKDGKRRSARGQQKLFKFSQPTSQASPDTYPGSEHIKAVTMLIPCGGSLVTDEVSIQARGIKGELLAAVERGKPGQFVGDYQRLYKALKELGL